MPAMIDLSHALLEFRLDTAGRLALRELGLPGDAWALPDSGLFRADLNGMPVDANTPDLLVRAVALTEDAPGARHATITLAHEATGALLEYHVVVYADYAALESWVVVRNQGARPLRVTRLDSFALHLAPGDYDLRSFTGDWGCEFEPQHTPLSGEVVLESRSGRSSRGNLPWFGLGRAGHAQLAGAVAWSGNWAVRVTPRAAGGYTLCGGLHDWEFAIELAPGASAEAPPAALALAAGNDLDALATQFGALGRRYWYPRNELADSLPVEWNHWWSYEDRTLDEATFRANVDIAARLGMEVCTLDAGWFGADQSDTHWYEQRGDWDLVNTTRFPSGIRALADYTHQRGMRFGIWCEIEGLGIHARLAQTHPELVATRGGERIGYVCLGSRVGREWAFATLDRLVREYDCDWIKLDFNLNPEAGCDRTDHGHGAGDGLYEHYRGYYELLDRMRAAHPHVVLENCSSGGLRIDLGIARRTHMAFLSDPDWPEHSLQLFWGASALLAPDAILHWGFCEWCFAQHPRQTFNPDDPALKPHQIDYYTRISMLRRFGFSQRLPNLPDWVAQRYARHIDFYKSVMRGFVRNGVMYRLTEQPLRDGRGDRWAGFQYAMPDGGEHLVAIFRLPGGAPYRALCLKHLQPDRRYTLSWIDSGQETQASGAELMANGVQCDDLPEEGSALLLVR